MTIRRYSLPACLVLVLLFPPMIWCQSPRPVFVEEVTNASCGICASTRNARLRALKALDYDGGIIPIAWHSSVEGKDQLNEANPEMHNARIDYYNGIGALGYRVNGHIQTDLPGLGRSISSMPTMSPITITINQIQTSDSISAEIMVSSIEEVAATLYVAVVEGYHFDADAGTREREFYHVARQMLPSPQGTPITIHSGTSVTVTPGATALKSEWLTNYLYVVAWIQNDETKEVYQAASTRGRLISRDPNLRTGIVVSDESENTRRFRFDPNVTGKYSITVIKEIPYGWKAKAEVDGTAISHTVDSLSMSIDTPIDIDISLTPAFTKSKNRVGTVMVTIVGPRHLQFTRTYRLYSSDIDILMMFRQYWPSSEFPPAYTGPFLQADTYSYATVAAGDEDLFDYRNHVMLMATEKSGLRAEDIEMLRRNFDAGGMRLMLTGAEIGYTLADPTNIDSLLYPGDEDFMRDYLHARYVRDDNPSDSVSGIPGDPVSDGNSYSLNGGMQNQNTPDEILPTEGAVPTFYYGSIGSEVAGLRYADGVNRLLYFAFGLEGIGSADRTGILLRGVDWLLSDDLTTAVNDDSEVEAAGLIGAHPTPAVESLSVDLQLQSPTHVTLRLYDLVGNEVGNTISLNLEEGKHRRRINVADFPPGIYTLVADIGSQVESRVVIVVR